MGIQRDKLDRSLGGIADMKKIPDMIFIVDTNIEELAVKEAVRLNIPIVAILDTNSDPTGISHPIPGNDDARQAINLYCDLIKQTILDAQKNISPINNDKDEKKKEIAKNIDEPKESQIKGKSTKKNKPPKTEVVKKISKSILSKVKSLTSKKKK
jgi:small subunit ribosomal protein S2